MTRDATQLTGSVTYFNLGGDRRRRSGMNSTLFDYTTVEMFTQELRLGFRLRRPLPVGARRLLQRHRARLRPDACRRPGYDAIMERLCRRARWQRCERARRCDMPFFSRIPYDFEQMAVFAEASFDIDGALEPRLSARRYYDFEEDRDLYFAGLSRTHRRPEPARRSAARASTDRRRPAARAVRRTTSPTTCS